MKIYRTDEFTDTGVYLFRQSKAQSDTLHTHNFTELVYVAEGSCTQNVNGRTFHASAGDVILIEEGQTHAFQTNGTHFVYTNLILSREFLSLYAEDPLFCVPTDTDLPAVTLSKGEQELFHALLDGIAAETLRTRYASLSAIGGMVRACLSLFYRHLHEKEEDQRTGGRFAPLLAEIEERLAEKITLASLAARAGYDEAYFSRAFKREMHCSPMAYVTERRVYRAAALLSGTNLQIAEIGARCGFSDRSVMARAFRRVLGKSPRELREQS